MGGGGSVRTVGKWLLVTNSIQLYSIYVDKFYVVTGYKLHTATV